MRTSPEDQTCGGSQAGAPRQRSILRMERGSQQLQLSSPGSRRNRLRLAIAAAAAAVALAGLAAVAPSAHASCAVPGNEIEAENCLPGTPQNQWDVSGMGDSSIQGFATEISVPQGGTVHFKIDTDAASYQLEIYRMGYYGGDGARLVATVAHNGAQTQPACQGEASTGLTDCGNWAESASWAVPATAVSGIYFAKVVRSNGGASHIVFVVRDDDGNSDLLFQTSDTTWQAYNQFGGNSLYVGNPVGRAYKVSYNRPFTTRGTGAEDWVFNAEYPMVRWLERNGYDVSYFTGVDTDARGAELLEHKGFLSVGHDEYWSGTQRANVEAARNAGVDMAFFSGNEVFWKTRWENNHRTLVTYKETHANAKIDPTSTWTGSWRDPRFSPPADGGRPENALTGTIFTVNAGSAALEVPAADGKLRLWRGTSVAQLLPGDTATLGDDTVGYEWDEDLDNGFRPPGLVRMSSTTVTGVDKLQDYGSNYGPGTATHSLTLYRDSNGAGVGDDALVFGGGTVQWSWGLDADHDRGSAPANAAMQQATVNLFADMGIQPRTLQSGLAAASASTDMAAPTPTITAPAAGSSVEQRIPITVQGTAVDAGGRVGGVEVSVDNGATWHPANGRDTWSYTWTPTTPGQVTVRARATDDSGNLSAPATVTVTVGGRSCPCSLFGQVTPSGTTVDDDPVEVGVRFRSDQAGTITGLRYYRGAGWTGSFVGHLWRADGTQLAAVPFPAAASAGWQQVALPQPVRIDADTVYVASFFSPDGFYVADADYFGTAYDAAPLHAPTNPNGVFTYGGGFPSSTFNNSNYWADVVFAPEDGTPPAVTTVAPASGSTGVGPGTKVTATFSEPLLASSVGPATVRLRTASGAAVSAGVTYAAGARTATLTPSAPLTAGARYTATVQGVQDAAGNAMASAFSWSFTVAPAAPPSGGPQPGSEPGDLPGRSATGLGRQRWRRARGHQRSRGAARRHRAGHREGVAGRRASSSA